MDVLTFLGTGGGTPTVDRGHSSLLLEEGGSRWLLDAGNRAANASKQWESPSPPWTPCLSARTLGSSFRTSNGDPRRMAGGPPSAASDLSPGGINRPAPCVARRGVSAREARWFPTGFHAWEPLSGTSALPGGGKLRVSVNPTTHLNGLRALIDETGSDRFRAFSMVFDWPNGKRLIYSADLGRPDDLTPLLAQPCDLLICEMAHFEPEELFSYLLDKPVRRLALTHFKAELNVREAEIREMGATRLPAVTEVAVMHDGTRLEF